MVDFAEEITGSPSQRIKIKGESNRKRERMSHEDTEAASGKIEKMLKNGNTVAIG